MHRTSLIQNAVFSDSQGSFLKDHFSILLSLAPPGPQDRAFRKVTPYHSPEPTVPTFDDYSPPIPPWLFPSLAKSLVTTSLVEEESGNLNVSALLLLQVLLVMQRSTAAVR